MFFTVVQTIILVACCTLCGIGTMRTLQAQRYRTAVLLKQMRGLGGRLLAPDILIALVTALVNWYLPILLSMIFSGQEQREAVCGWVVLGVFAAVAVLLFLRRQKASQEQPLNWTHRILRLIIATALLNLVCTLFLILLSVSPYLIFAATDYVVILAAFIMRPIEDRLNARYYGKARKKLAAHANLIRIGITGSYGKTQTKMILKGILSTRFKVLATPPSFSTAMGISRVINEQLLPEHRVFIAEMGAQRKGEIREMVKIVRPQYGVLTCIGNAHIDSFGSIESIAQAKYELIQGLPKGGCAFFGSDGSYCDRLYALCKSEKYRAGIDPEVRYQLRAADIETGVHGTRFELIGENGEHMRMKTPLLGEYNVRNIALAALVARKMGMTPDEIARAVEKLKPIRHQMQLIPGEINVIDDSENGLPDAAAMALRVLRDFPGRRILVTQGFDDLGEGADTKSFAFGMQIMGCADYVVLIDPDYTTQIMRGMLNAHFPKSEVRMVSNEEDAVSLIREKAQPGDTILYEGIFPEAEG